MFQGLEGGMGAMYEEERGSEGGCRNYQREPQEMRWGE